MSRIKVIDFGLSYEVDGDLGQVIDGCGGTHYYMAPEQIESKMTRKVDIWAVGVIMYRMLIGKLPFIGFDSDEIFKAIQT